jgi:sulfur relay (sulfurtransferase) DsrC/TusE family protein
MNFKHLQTVKLNIERHTELLEACEWSEELLHILLEKTKSTLQDLESCFFILDSFEEFSEKLSSRMLEYATDDQIIIILKYLERDLEVTNVIQITNK